MQHGEDYEINVNLSYVDENPAKKDTESVVDELKIGENIYYVEYTTQVKDKLKDPNNDGILYLKAGDYINVSVKNTSQTLYQVFKNFIYSVNDASPQITGEYSGLITTDGSNVNQAVYNKEGVETYEIKLYIGADAEFESHNEGYTYPEVNDKYATVLKKKGENNFIINPGTVKNNDSEKILDGWSRNKDSNKIDYRPGSKYTKNEDITLYAVWKEKTYKVEYYKNPPRESGASADVKIDGDKKKGEYKINWTPQVQGYIFKNWTTNQDGTGDSYNNGSIIELSNEICNINNDTFRVYAQWEKEPSKIIYDSNVKIKKVLYVGGYTSPGTYESALDTGKKIIEYLNNNDEFEINYDGNDYIIINGENASDRAQKIQRIFDRKYRYDLIILNFSVWSMYSYGFNSENLEKIAKTNDLITIANDDKTATMIQDTDTYNNQNNVNIEVEITGIGRQLISEAFRTETMYQHDSYCVSTKFRNTVNVLYKAKYTNADGEETYADAIGYINCGEKGKNVWVHSQVAIDKEMIYQLAKATLGLEVYNMPEKEEYTPGATATISDVVPTRAGYNFLGWSLYDGKKYEAKYTGGDKINIGNKNITLYAVWDKNVPYTVIYDGNAPEYGAIVTDVPDRQTLEYGSSYTIPDNEPKTDDYIFLGWSILKSAKIAEYFPGKTYNSNVNIELYAIWRPRIRYNVYYDANTTDLVIGLTTQIQVVKERNNWIVDSQIPDRADYEFMGWSDRRTSTTADIFPGENKGPINRAIQVYAIWEEEVPDDKNTMAPNSTWYRSSTDKSQITEIEFANRYEPTGSESEEFNCDVNNSGTIKGYIIGTKLVISKSKLGKIYANSDSSSMFRDFTKVTTINNITILNTSNVTNMEYMFTSCQALTSIDLSNFNTNNVTNMRYMFASCFRLNNIDLSNFNTNRVTNMQCMFASCYDLTNLDLRNCNTSNVTNMEMMFYSCNKITNLDLGSFNTSNVTNMMYMFNNCRAITNLDLSNFDTRNVTAMSYMFAECNSLVNLDLSSFNTTKVTNYTDIYKNCIRLFMVKLGAYYTLNSKSNLPTPISEYIPGANGYWYNIETENGYTADSIPNYTTATYRAVGNPRMASGSTWYKGTTDKRTITEIEFMNGGIPEGTITEQFNCDINNRGTIKGYIVGTKLYISGTGTEKIYANANASTMFYNFRRLTKITNLRILYTNDVTNMQNMFYQCRALTSLDLSNFNTSNVINMNKMFDSCINLTSLNLNGFDTRNVTDMSSMFNGCSSLASINLNGFNTSNVTNMSSMFSGCSSLTSIDVYNFNTNRASNISSMFTNCSGLQSIDLSNFYISSSTLMSELFAYCGNLRAIDISNFETNSGTSGSNMYTGCNYLMQIKIGANYKLANLPTPSSSYISGADGKWYDTETGIGYTPFQIPNNNKTTIYTAIPTT